MIHFTIELFYPQEEGMKVEMRMQRLALEQVKEERMKGEVAVKVALKRYEDKLAREEGAAITHALNVERKVAQEAEIKLKR